MRASVVIGALFFLVGHGTLHRAEQKVPSGLAAVLIAIEPVAILMRGSISGSGAGVLVSAMAILIGAFSWALGIVYSRRSQRSGHPLLLSSFSLLSGAILLLVEGTVAREYRGFALSTVASRSWIALAYLIVFGSVIAFSAYNWLLERYAATLVATHTYVNPIVAVLLGWLIAAEKIP